MPGKKDPASKPRKKSAVLTEQQAQYVGARASGLNRKDSLASAGYSPNPSNATEIEKNPSVKELLSLEYRKNAGILGITREDVLYGLKEAVQDAKILADPMGQIAGWREIAKICGYYAPEVRRIELGTNAKNYMQHLEQLDDAELLKLAESDVIDVDFTQVPNG